MKWNGEFGECIWSLNKGQYNFVEEFDGLEEVEKKGYRHREECL